MNSGKRIAVGTARQLERLLMLMQELERRVQS